MQRALLQQLEEIRALNLTLEQKAVITV